MATCAAVLAAVLPPFYRSVGILPGVNFGPVDELIEAGVSCYPDLLAPGTPPLLDVIVADAGGAEFSDWAASLRRIRLRLQRHGALFVFTGPTGPDADALLTALQPLGFGFFLGWHWDGTPEPPEPSATIYDQEAAPALLRFQRFSYDPVAHAREHLREMGFGYGLAVLNEVPEHWYTSDEARGLHEAERLVCLLAQDRHAGPRLRLLHFVAALHAYNRACTLVPLHVPAYQCMAAFWRGVGRPDMGRRLLTTVETILPSPAGKESLGRLTGEGPASVDFSYPVFQPEHRPRILFLCHPESDYGADVLFDGLRRVLGVENVVGYPWKPTLHGECPELAFGYPCLFNWPDAPLPLGELEQELSDGRFDVILHCDAHGTLPVEDTRRLLEAAGNTPVFLLDTWDECGNLQEIIPERDGIRHVAGYFKREMVAGLDYGPNAWPLPFAYPEDRFMEWDDSIEREGVFWAGKLIGGARRLLLSWLTPQVPIAGAWGTPYTQEDYANLLQRHAMGLCFFGNGFDTVRYWELPAHGVMLLAERSPLNIPNNFEDGVHAVYFDHAGDLLEKTRYYLAHPEEAAAIASAGHAHAREYHTETVRARQCLGVIQARLAEYKSGS